MNTFVKVALWHAAECAAAVEGDVRLVNETSIANWQVGRVEVFFEGSWSQVCSAGFDGTDADVACRQLGYGVGSSAASATGVSEELSVYPEVAITLPDCNGSEASLLACGGEVPTGISRFGATRGCFQDGDKGLLLACVAQPMPGMIPVPAAAHVACATSTPLVISSVVKVYCNISMHQCAAKMSTSYITVHQVRKSLCLYHAGHVCEPFANE